MDKYKDNALVEPMDAVILLSDDYEKQGLKRGYIGVVVDNFIKTDGIILADFFNPFTGEDVAVQAKIKKNDFKVVSSSADDQKKVKVYKQLFKEN